MITDDERRTRRFAQIGALVTVIGAATASWIGGALVFFGLLLLLFACFSSRDGFLLVGPIAWADLARNARRGRPWLWRAIYAVVAGMILGANLAVYLPELLSLEFTLKVRSLHRLAMVNEQIGNWFAVCLFLYVGFVTVQVLAPAIAEDREAKRWDTLLTTDLRPREILFGKLFGRMPMIFDPILSAIPIVALLPIYGGVPVWFGAAVLMACVSVIFGLAGLCFFYSLFSLKVKDAAVRVTVICFFYLAASGIVWSLSKWPQVWSFPTSLGFFNSPLEISDLVEGLSAGNPIVVVVRHFNNSGPTQETDTLKMVARFAAFHLGVFFLFGFMAMKRLRTAEPWGPAKAPTQGATNRLRGQTPVKPPANQTGTAPRAKSKIISAEKPVPVRPPTGDWSVYWWEIYYGLNDQQIKNRLASLEKKRLITLFAFSFLMNIVLSIFSWMNPSRETHEIRHIGTFFFSMILAVTGFVLVLPPLFRAAKCVSRERNADTWEALLVTGYTPKQILVQKLLAVASYDLGLFLLAIVSSVPAALLGVLPFYVPILYAIVVPLIVFWFASVGLFFSVRLRRVSWATWACIGFLFTLYIAVSFLSFATTALVANKADTWMVLSIVYGLFVLFLLFVGYRMWVSSVRLVEQERVN